jgi:hypothetical protein
MPRSHRTPAIGLAAGLALLGMSAAGRAQSPATQPADPAPLAQAHPDSLADPTLLTLDRKEADPRAIFAEIAWQSGYDIQPYRHENWDQAYLPNISITANQQPFWQVFRTACLRADLSLVNIDEAPRVFRLNPARQGGNNVMQYPSSVSGPFLLAVTAIEKTDAVDLAQPETLHHSLSMRLGVLVEPKVKVLRYAIQPRVDEAVDNQGHSLKKENPITRSMNAPGGILLNMSLPLQCPDHPGDKIALLRGSIQLTVQDGSQIIEIPDILNATDITRSADSMTLTVKKVARQPDRQYSADAIFTRGSMDRNAFMQLMQKPPIWLVDANGREFPYHGYSGNGGSRGQKVELTLRFARPNRGGDEDAVGKPVKLVWEVATGTRQLTVPFEFKNLPLP